MVEVSEVCEGVSEGNAAGGTEKTVLMAVPPRMETTATCSAIPNLPEFVYSSKALNPFLQHRSDPEQ